MSKQVQQMFSSIAARYDLANDVLSLGMHRLWRRVAVGKLNKSADFTALDLCTGTGDIARRLASQIPERGRVIALDFVPEMLNRAKELSRSSRISFILGDASHICLNADSVDLITIAFGIRNVDDPLDCLKEMRRVLRSGGQVRILEFGAPNRGVIGSIYRFYSTTILPAIGGFLTGNRSAYEYLPRTSHAFPTGNDFLILMQHAGFENCVVRSMMGGIAYLYVGHVSKNQPKVEDVPHNITNRVANTESHRS